MRPAYQHRLLLALAVNVLVVATVVTFVVRGIRDAAVLVGVVGMLALSLLVRRRFHRRPTA